jgi:transcriptional regulator with XRE-family HTH domain
MKNSIYAYVLRQLKRTSLTYQEVADGSGVSKRTIEKIAREEISDPGVSHIENLEAFFRRMEVKAKRLEARVA